MAREVTQIKLLVTPEEDQQIRNNAKAAGRTVSAYIRAMALDLVILQCDTSEINAHVHEISSLRNAINQLIYTIQKTGDYYPAELEAIHDLMEQIMVSEKKFLAKMEKDIPRKQKEIRKEAKKVVDRRLKQTAKKQERAT
jgi:hypothetical protein